MADTTQGDTDGQYPALLVPSLIDLLAGLLIHSFIIGVNVTDWWKGRSVTPVDLIVTSLGVSRICAQSANALYLLLNTLSLINPNSHITQIIMDTVYTFFTYSNFWITSLLSIVLCLKISNLHTRLFLYLRRMIEHRTGYLIGASGLLFVFNCFLFLSIAIIDRTRGGTSNVTKQHVSTGYTYINSMYTYIVGSFFPLLFYYISSVLLFTSLYHHTRKMKISSNLSINLETYYSVMRFVSVTFMYNTIYFIGHFVCMFYYYFYCMILSWLYISLDVLLVLHSSYLVYKTAKLRSQMSKVLQDMVDFLFQRKDPETRENIEIVAQ